MLSSSSVGCQAVQGRCYLSEFSDHPSNELTSGQSGCAPSPMRAVCHNQTVSIGNIDNIDNIDNIAHISDEFDAELSVTEPSQQEKLYMNWARVALILNILDSDASGDEGVERLLRCLVLIEEVSTDIVASISERQPHCLSGAYKRMVIRSIKDSVGRWHQLFRDAVMPLFNRSELNRSELDHPSLAVNDHSIVPQSGPITAATRTPGYALKAPYDEALASYGRLLSDPLGIDFFRYKQDVLSIYRIKEITQDNRQGDMGARFRHIEPMFRGVHQITEVVLWLQRKIYYLAQTHPDPIEQSKLYEVSAEVWACLNSQMDVLKKMDPYAFAEYRLSLLGTSGAGSRQLKYLKSYCQKLASDYAQVDNQSILKNPDEDPVAYALHTSVYRSVIEHLGFWNSHASLGACTVGMGGSGTGGMPVEALFTRAMALHKYNPMLKQPNMLEDCLREQCPELSVEMDGKPIGRSLIEKADYDAGALRSMPLSEKSVQPASSVDLKKAVPRHDGPSSIFVTGGTGGIGKEILMRYAGMIEDHAMPNRKLIFSYRSRKACADQIKASIQSRYPHVVIESVYLDLGKASSIDDLVQHFSRTDEEIGILILNAAVGSATVMDQVSEHAQSAALFEQATKFFMINTVAPHSLYQQLQSRFDRNGEGTSVVVISSVGGGDRPFSGFNPYDGGSKAALEYAFSVSAKEEMNSPIHIVTVRPGATNTPMLQKSTLDEMSLDEKQRFMARLPKQELVEADEIAELVVSVSEPRAAKLLHGSALSASKGLHAQYYQ